MAVVYAEIMRIEGGESVARERGFPAALNAEQIKSVDGKPMLRPLVDVGYDAFAAACGTLSSAYVIGPAEVTKTWTVDLAKLKPAACARIDAAAEARRLIHVTDGCGQGLAYGRKADQAVACLAAHDAQNPPSPGAYPALDAEVGITGDDVIETATVIAARAGSNAAVFDAIETIRLGAKRDISEAADAAAVEAALATLVWPEPQ